MPIRTKEQLVLAANQSIDITGLVSTYLVKLERAAYSKHYKGYRNPVKVTDPFIVNIVSVGENNVNVVIAGTTTVVCETPTYYGPDDESFSEGYGSSNVSGYSSHTYTKPVEQVLSIPFGCLLRTEEQMLEDVNNIVTKWIEEDKAEAKANEIARLEKKLAAVRAS